ncbi:E3 ubiquitin ligase family protein [Natrononativus amylolyticus]|uniref:E3 ubiquitin ligase family protein n=1 Tax=Natrononativus amylolyticus TaxID=2963434 RepID=UPI0020CC53BE|nr:E3 ubiquitin ligase family protein [Natrononativus amylolyticus]
MVTSPDPVAVALLAVIGLVALFPLLYGVRELRLANHVLRSRPHSVLEATNGGPVELRGTAEPAGRTLRGPLSGARCLAYEYEVREKRQSKNGHSWKTIDSGEARVPFRLNDGSGSVLIEPPGADVRLHGGDRLDVDGGTAPPDSIQAFIDENEAVDCQNSAIDLRLFELRTGTDRRFVERRLEIGEEVHVLGTARHDTTVATATGQVNAAVGVGEAALSSSPVTRLWYRLNGYPFVISDRSERGLGLRAGAAGLGVIAVTLVVVVGVAATVL